LNISGILSVPGQDLSKIYYVVMMADSTIEAREL